MYSKSDQCVEINKQPRALYVFFLTELWERYGFYAIIMLLVFYFEHVFHLTDKESYEILGSITALAYGNSVLGGYIADRLIGHRLAVLCGAVMLWLGYTLAALSNELNIALAAFAIVTVGTGLLKPNISSLLGFLYKKNDVRRQSGYTIFFVGINIGAILAGPVAGLIQEYFGWHSVFFSASFALFMAFVIFWIGTRYLTITNIIQQQKSVLAGILISTSILVSYYVIAHPKIAAIFFFVVAIICMGLILYHAYKTTGMIRKKLLAFLALIGISTFYWALYFQIFFSMNLFVERVVDRHVLGITLVPTVFPSIESFGVIFIGLFLGWGWRRLESLHPQYNPSIPMKFALACFVGTVAFTILYLSSFIVGENSLVMPEWLIAAYLLLALSELLISPIGLAMVGELVPEHLTGIMMGIFFITQGLGSKLSGVMASFSAVPKTMLNNMSIISIEQIYQHSFLSFCLFSLLITIIGLSLVPMLKKLMA